MGAERAAKIIFGALLHWRPTVGWEMFFLPNLKCHLKKYLDPPQNFYLEPIHLDARIEGGMIDLASTLHVCSAIVGGIKKEENSDS